MKDEREIPASATIIFLPVKKRESIAFIVGNFFQPFHFSSCASIAQRFIHIDSIMI